MVKLFPQDTNVLGSWLHLSGFWASNRLTDISFDHVTVSFLHELETRIKKDGSTHNTTQKHLDIVKRLSKYAKANYNQQAVP